MATKLEVNGKAVTVEAAPDTPLLWVIRDELNLTGTKYGCGVAQCGACTVHIDGVATRSCITQLSRVAGKKVTTIEGLGGDHPVQKAWIKNDVPQCGYCQSGQVMSAVSLLKTTPKPTEQQIIQAYGRQHLPLRHLQPHPGGGERGLRPIRPEASGSEPHSGPPATAGRFAFGAVMTATLRGLMADTAIAKGDGSQVRRLLVDDPALAHATMVVGATRQAAVQNLLIPIGCYVYAGDTALHIAAAAYDFELVDRLIAMGAKVSAANRRGAAPLHYAASGAPGSSRWNPDAQARTIARLIAAGADPDALDKSGVAALHRAVRTRCSAAVEALLEGGASPALTNANGSTPLFLATRQTGRGGRGSPAAQTEQAKIIVLLESVAGRSS